MQGYLLLLLALCGSDAKEVREDFIIHPTNVSHLASAIQGKYDGWKGQDCEVEIGTYGTSPSVANYLLLKKRLPIPTETYARYTCENGANTKQLEFSRPEAFKKMKESTDTARAVAVKAKDCGEQILEDVKSVLNVDKDGEGFTPTPIYNACDASFDRREQLF